MGTWGTPSQVLVGQERIVVYYSRTVSKARRNYCYPAGVTGYCESLEHLHKYLYGQVFQLHTNHSALTLLQEPGRVVGPIGPTSSWIQLYMRALSGVKAHQRKCIL
jgi:hypothetical protein